MPTLHLKITGISAFTKNINARRRWMITHSVRNAIIGCLFELAGLKETRRCSTRILRDNRDTKKRVSFIENTLNPFDETYQDENMFCLSTGKATSQTLKL